MVNINVVHFLSTFLRHWVEFQVGHCIHLICRPYVCAVYRSERMVAWRRSLVRVLQSLSTTRQCLSRTWRIQSVPLLLPFISTSRTVTEASMAPSIHRTSRTTGLSRYSTRNYIRSLWVIICVIMSLTYICRINLLSNYIAAVSCPVSALTLLVGRQWGHLTCKKLNVGLLVVMIWLQLCTSYSSSCHQSPPLPSSLASIKPANPGLHGKVAVKTERGCCRVAERQLLGYGFDG